MGATASLRTNDLVDGRYRLLAPLGEGTFGAVWQAADTRLVNRPVALKFLKEDLLGNQAAVARFDTEADTPPGHPLFLHPESLSSGTAAGRLAARSAPPCDGLRRSFPSESLGNSATSSVEAGVGGAMSAFERVEQVPPGLVKNQRSQVAFFTWGCHVVRHGQ